MRIAGMNVRIRVRKVPNHDSISLRLRKQKPYLLENLGKELPERRVVP